MRKKTKNLSKAEYRACHQQALLAEMKLQLSHTNCVLIIDFSENYSCKYTSETQSVHFSASRSQVTMHTAVLYYRTTEAEAELQCKSFCTVSDNLRHYPAAIWVHLKPVLYFVAKNVPAMESINIRSDGLTTQYRNKYNFAIFAQLGSITKFKKATWNFTESGYCKRPADGIGGSVKHQLDHVVSLGRHITNAQVVFTALSSQSVNSTDMYIITDSNIADTDEQFAASNDSREQ